MKKKPLLLALGIAGALGLLQPTALLAHEDVRLETQLAADPAGTGRSYQEASLLAQLANLYQSVGQEEKSRQLLKRSKEAANGIKDKYVREYVIGHTANEIASTGDFERAIALLDTIEDTEIWVKTAWKLASKTAKAKQPELTRKLLVQSAERSHRVEDLVLRSELLSGTGAGYRYLERAEGVPLVYEAYGIAQSLSDPYERAIMFNEAGAHLMDVGHRDKALAVFDEVAQLVDRIDNPLQQAKALAMLGGEQAEKGERERAAQALERGVKIAQRLPAGEEAYAVQSEIARNFGQSHRFEQGIAAADAIADPYHRAEGYIRIAKNMYRMKRQDDAQALVAKTTALANEIKDPYLQAIVLRKLASEHLDMKNQDKAVELLNRALAQAEAIPANKVAAAD